MSTIKFRPHSGEVLNLGCSWFFYLSRMSKNFWKQSMILLKYLSQKMVSCTGFMWNDSHFNLMFIISLYPFTSFKHGVTLCYHCHETNFTHGTWLSFSFVVKHPYPIWTGSFRSSLNPQMLQRGTWLGVQCFLKGPFGSVAWTYVLKGWHGREKNQKYLWNAVSFQGLKSRPLILAMVTWFSDTFYYCFMSAEKAGDLDHLAATFLLAHNIAHGNNLRKSTGLQYLYYLAQVSP